MTDKLIITIDPYTVSGLSRSAAENPGGYIGQLCSIYKIGQTRCAISDAVDSLIRSGELDHADITFFIDWRTSLLKAIEAIYVMAAKDPKTFPKDAPDESGY